MKKLLLIALVVLSCSSCATIISGSKKRVTFDSDMKGSAKMIVDGRRYHDMTFPCKVNIKRGFSDTVVRVEAEGYEPQTIYIDKTLNPWAILNLADIVGWVIDAATGAVTQPDSDYYWIDMKPATK